MAGGPLHSAKGVLRGVQVAVELCEVRENTAARTLAANKNLSCHQKVAWSEQTTRWIPGATAACGGGGIGGGKPTGVIAGEKLAGSLVGIAAGTVKRVMRECHDPRDFGTVGVGSSEVLSQPCFLLLDARRPARIELVVAIPATTNLHYRSIRVRHRHSKRESRSKECRKCWDARCNTICWENAVAKVGR
jgi:hypothetical protein